MKQEDAEEFVHSLEGVPLTVHSIERKRETKNPPLLYNLAELQNDCPAKAISASTR